MINETSQNLRRTMDTFIQTAQFDALIDTCKIALGDARNRGDMPTEVLSLVGLAYGHQYNGKFNEARILIDGAIQAAKRFGDRSLIAMALIASGEIFARTVFQAYEAERDYQEALTIAQSLDQQALVSQCLVGLSIAFMQMDDRARAERFARKAFDIAREINERYFMSKSLMMIGTAVTKSQPEKALQAFEDAMLIAQTDNFRLMELELTGRIGHLLCREGRYADDGQLMLEKALSMAKDFRSVPHEFTAMYRVGRALEQNGALDRAAQYYGNMLERSQKWRARAYEGVAFFNLGILAYNRTHYDDAISNFEQALVIAREIKNPFQEAQTEQMLGSSYFNLSEYDQALDHYMAARSIYDSLDNRLMANTLLQRIVMVYIQRLFSNVLHWLGLSSKNDDSGTNDID